MLSIEVNLDENGRPDRDEDGFYQFPVEANDDAVEELIGDPRSDYTLTRPAVALNRRASPYGGEFGLGDSFAYLKTVRPYRVVFETSSLFRINGKPISVQHEATDSPIALEDKDQLDVAPPTIDTPVPPFVAYENNDDQAVAFEPQVIGQFSEERRRY